MRHASYSRFERHDFSLPKLWTESSGDWVSLGSSPAAAPANDLLTVRLQAISNDTDYVAGRMWGMYGDKTSPANAYGSQAGEAWAAGYTGSMKVAIGVIDSGVDYTHKDLFSNIWLNQGEIPFSVRGLLVDTDGDKIFTFRDLNASVNGGLVRDFNLNGRIDGGDLLQDSRWANGVDEAGNGYVDDLIGWDFANNDNNPMDDQGHGTHVSGTIGARGGDGIGVAGVAWNTEIVALKFMDASGSGYTNNAARAVDYFTGLKSSNVGIDFAATSNSWGGGGYTQDLQDAITRAAKADILFVAAAGNGGSDGIGDNTDLAANYPSNYSTAATAGYDNVISVAAITSTGALASFSNYGAKTVDIAAPGVGIYSTTMGGGYGYMSGTSMATPHVAGAIALFSAAHPEYSASQIRAELLSSGIQTASLSGKTVTGARLDVAEFVSIAAPAPTVKAIYGTAGNDTIHGSIASEKIYGIAAVDSKLGMGTKDTLYGGGGADTFVLGDSRGLFYDDHAPTLSGWGDGALIKDFDAGDKIQLSGTFSDYVFRTMAVNGVTGTTIYQDSNHNGKADSVDEYVAHVQGPAALALTPEHFVFG